MDKILRYIIVGSDKLSPVLARAGKTSLTTGQKMTAAFSVIGAAAAAAGIASVHMAMDFEESMVKITSLVGVSQKQVDVWSKQLLMLGPAVGKSPKELANALFFVTSAGLRGSKAIDVLTMSAKASAAGLGETKTVADAVTSAVNAYQRTGLRASTVTDTLVAAVREGKMPVEDLAGAIGMVLPLASEVGISFSEVAGTAAALSRVGAPVNKTMTGIRFLLTSLIKPAAASVKALEGIGMSADDIRRSLKEKGLLATLQDLKAKLPINGFLQVVGGARGVITALGLVGQNGKMSADVLNKVASAAGSTERAFAITAETSKFKMAAAWSAIQSAGIQLGGILLPIVGQIAGGLATVVGAFTRMPGPVKIATLAIMGLSVALWLISAHPIVAIAAAIIALTSLIIKYWPQISAAFITGWNAVKTVTVGVWQSIWTFLSGIWGGMVTAGRATVNAFVVAWSFISRVYDIVVGFFSGIKDWITTNFNTWWASNGEAIKRIWNAVWTVVVAVFRFTWNTIVAAAQFYWAVFTTVFKTGRAILLGVWNAIWPIVKAVFQAAWNIVVMMARAGWIIIQTVFGIGAAAIRAIWNILWVVVKTIFTLAWKSVQTTLKIGWDIIVGLFTFFINIVTGRWGAAWRALKNMFVQIWNAMRSFLGASLNGMWTVITTTFGNITNFFRGLPGRILRAIGSLARLLWNAGKEVIGGMLGGIWESMKNIGSWVKIHIVDPVINAVKHFFGIKSPSTVMAGIGGNLIKGLLKGLITSNPLGLIGKVFGGMPNALASIIGKGLIGLGKLPAKAVTALGKAASWAWGGLKSVGGFFGKIFGGGGSGVQRWAGLVSQVLAMFGQPQSLIPTVLRRMNQESGGNPFAQNNWDSNAQMGQASRGLMQTIPATFAAYAGPFRSRGIFDPLANIYASFGYALSRYGSLSAAFNRAGGYAKGTKRAARGWAWVGENGPELMHFGGGEAIGPYAGGVGRGGGNIIWTGDVIVQGHALSSKQEIGRTVSDALTEFGRKGGSVPYVKK